MRILYILFFLFTNAFCYCQTYDFDVIDGVLCNTCWEGPQGPTYNTFEATKFTWSVKQNSTITIASGNKNGYVPNGKNTTNYTNKVFSTTSTFLITITSTGSVHYENGSSGSCNTNTSVTATLDNLIINGFAGFSDSPCGITARITNFKPSNLVITNLNVGNPNNVCAGEMLNLSVNGAGSYPNVAFHWQYSVDNSTWIDFPTAKNNRTITEFSIQELLGNSHINYFNKPLYFRLGYIGRPFTNTFTINYSPCAPVAERIFYQGPKCNGDNIQAIDVFFDRNLTQNEDINIMYVLNSVTSAISFQNTAIIKSLVFDSAVQKYKYSFTNLGKLENGQTYNIKYQTRLNEQNTGALESTNTPFKYVDPEKLSFNTKSEIPSCLGGDDGLIEITITNGTPPFHFYKNHEEVTPEYNNGKYYIRNLSQGNYNIVVTDASGCIDKTAND
ncbi:hypothetical protein BB050_00094 [Flavobacterium anhuiense]|uniref:SprB repeat-containing protein n=1 Tax=Flavobacterium anhuiense TaxID=459526 RepID=A0AAC9GGA1_9FLAO|nr:hypothetical protein [Flavobacterium anhuiense]AOC93250.1 hypothetical protein BB050_00094 [Flavobacterium anhuiense]